MASKKTWKKRAKQQKRQADELYHMAVDRAVELAEIDNKILNAQLPGPDLFAWAMQLRDLVLEVATMRGLGAVPFSLSPPGMPDPTVQVGTSSGTTTEARDDGTYTMLQDNEVNPVR